MEQVIYLKASFMKDSLVGFPLTFFWVLTVYRTQNRVTEISLSMNKTFLSCLIRIFIRTAGVLWFVFVCLILHELIHYGKEKESGGLVVWFVGVA